MSSTESKWGWLIRARIFDAFSVGYLISTPFIFRLGLNSSGGAIEDANFAQALTYGFIFVTAGAGLSIAAVYRGSTTLGDRIYAPVHLIPPSLGGIPWYRSFSGLQCALVTAVTCALGVWVSQIDIFKLVEADRFNHAMRMFAQLSQPDWKILPRAILLMVETVYIAFMAMAFATPIAFVLSFFMARNLASSSRVLSITCFSLRFIFNIARSIEPVLWAIIFSIWASFGPFAGMLALMVHSVASLAKQYSEIVEGVEEGPIEGISSTGANRLQTVWFAIVPQVILPLISYTIYRWDTNVRMATILGFVGGGGIGTLLMEYQGQAQWPQVGCIIVVMAFVVWVLDSFSGHVRAALK